MRLLILFSFLYPPLQKKDKVGLSKLLFSRLKSFIYFQVIFVYDKKRALILKTHTRDAPAEPQSLRGTLEKWASATLNISKTECQVEKLLSNHRA